MTGSPDVRARIGDFLHDVCGVDRAEINDDLRLEDVDVESLELVALVQRLQEAYGVPLQDDRLLDIGTVGELAGLVTERVAAAEVAR